MLRTAGQFRVNSFVRSPPITDFNSGDFFRENNPYGVHLIVEESFRNTFLKDRLLTKHISRSELAGLVPCKNGFSDWEILSRLDEKAIFYLAHIAQLLVRQPKRLDPGALMIYPANNYFFVPVSHTGQMQRVKLVGKSFARGWTLSSQEIESLAECTPKDQVFACNIHKEASIL